MRQLSEKSDQNIIEIDVHKVCKASRIGLDMKPPVCTNVTCLKDLPTLCIMSAFCLGLAYFLVMNKADKVCKSVNHTYHDKFHPD